MVDVIKVGSTTVDNILYSGVMQKVELPDDWQKLCEKLHGVNDYAAIEFFTKLYYWVDWIVDGQPLYDENVPVLVEALQELTGCDSMVAEDCVMLLVNVYEAVVDEAKIQTADESLERKKVSITNLREAINECPCKGWHADVCFVAIAILFGDSDDFKSLVDYALNDCSGLDLICAF